ncbi:DUF2480 family protein [Tenacibaculum sp. SG-28]|uniref:DUF2480 family protein n=1 Tax=Tenacibaculum sp. SG-28 TaxID=754426 RepID=UPI000CF503C4|nr:DUF2480 family protein [Tenacibaculum sp. SG-28]PQJ21929.1 hypothetical protein BSU00_07860 [Tenacibaculum sp. SG-28]
MAGEIVNRVANSKLVTIDLEDFYPKGKRVVLDIKPWLFQELVLKEKEFRQRVSEHDWEQYRGAYVALTCSADAIIPSWAYLLLCTHVNGYAKKVVIGSLVLLETLLYKEIIDKEILIADFVDKPVIIKGCANKPIPDSAYTMLIDKIQPVAKRIMYGEACSMVPLYKKSN